MNKPVSLSQSTSLLPVDKFPHEADLIAAQTVISYIKNMMLTTAEQKGWVFEWWAFLRGILQSICRYAQIAKAHGFWWPVGLCEEYPHGTSEGFSVVSAQYQYICVDEAQDTSKIQHEIIRILASKTNNIFMVGDEDQSIYPLPLLLTLVRSSTLLIHIPIRIFCFLKQITVPQSPLYPQHSVL